jgi:hypothetical protein
MSTARASRGSHRRRTRAVFSRRRRGADRNIRHGDRLLKVAVVLAALVLVGWFAVALVRGPEAPALRPDVVNHSTPPGPSFSSSVTDGSSSARTPSPSPTPTPTQNAGIDAVQVPGTGGVLTTAISANTTTDDDLVRLREKSKGQKATAAGHEHRRSDLGPPEKPDRPAAAPPRP